MKNTLIGAALLTAVSLPASAGMSVPGASGLELYVKSGLDKSWKREDIIAGVTFSW